MEEVQSAAAACLGMLHKYAPVVGELLREAVAERSDGVSLGLLESAGEESGGSALGFCPLLVHAPSLVP